MTDEKLSGRVGLDTTDFKTNIAAMNRELRVLESGFRATAAGLGDWANDATGLETRIKSLNGQIDVQQRKVAALQDEYQRVAAEKGNTSRAAQDLEIKLNKETETLGTMQSELGETTTALADMEGGTQEAGDEMQEMEGQSGELNSGLSNLWSGISVGIGVLAAAAVAVIAAGAAIAGLVFTSANAASEFEDLSAKTGISTTRLQELKFIGDQIGVSLDTITGANARLTRAMGAAEDGTGTQAKAFKELGVAIVDSEGNLRDSQEVFADTLDALNGIENPAQRDVLAMELFGRSALELNPLIKLGSEAMGEMSEKANELGAVMSEETVSDLDNFGDTVDGMKAGLMGTLGTLAGSFLPGFSGIFDQLGGYLQGFTGIVKGSDGDFGKIAEGLTGLVGQIAGDLAKQLPTLIKAGMDILLSIIKGIITNLPTLIQGAIAVILALVDAIITNLPMLIEAALQMIITLALGIAQALPTLIPAVIEMLITIINTLIENLPMLINAGLQLILGLVQGIATALPILIEAIPKIIQAIIDTLTSEQMITMIVEAAPAIIVALINGLLTALPMLVEAIWEILKAIWEVMNDPEVDKRLRDAGKAILDGIWNGIKNNLDAFWKKIKDFALGIWKTVQDALLSKSPSKLFADTTGASIPAGIWQGIKAGMPELEKNLKSAMNGLNANIAIGGNGLALAGAGAGATSNDYSRHNQYIISNANIDAAELERIQQREAMLYGS